MWQHTAIERTDVARGVAPRDVAEVERDRIIGTDRANSVADGPTDDGSNPATADR
jgi:hypothetical protein